MTCLNFGGGIVCVNDNWGRLKVGNRYIWVDMHPWCGPSFFTDSDMSKVYDPVDETDPVWPVFGAWLDRKKAEKAKRAARKIIPSQGTEP